jgi:hypothetical protein
MSNEYTYGPINREDAEKIVRKVNALQSNAIREISIEPACIGYCIIVVFYPDKVQEYYQFFRGFIQGAASALVNRIPTPVYYGK